MTSGTSGPFVLNYLTDSAGYFDREPRRAALETLPKFGVLTETPFPSYLRIFPVVVASTVEKAGPLALSAEMVIELLRIRVAQQYMIPIPTLFPEDYTTREKPYGTVASMRCAFRNLKHIISHPIDGNAFCIHSIGSDIL